MVKKDNKNLLYLAFADMQIMDWDCYAQSIILYFLLS